MASLDKLARMDGWEVDESEDGSIDLLVPAIVEQRTSIMSTEDADMLDRTTTAAIGVLPSGSGQEDGSKTSIRDPTDAKEVQLEANCCSDGRDRQEKSSEGGNAEPLVASRETRPSVSSFAMSDDLRKTFPVAGRADHSRRVQVPGAERSRRPTRTVAPDVWGTSPLSSLPSQRSTLVGHLLEKSLGRGVGGGSGRSLKGGGVCTADEGPVVAKLKKSLKRAQQDVALERERRKMLEEQARMAYVPLKEESKRQHMEVKRGGQKGAAAGGLVGVSWERKTRSLSPVSREGGLARVTDIAEVAESHARMAVITDATEAAREEAHSALATVEGFAALNRKLVDELRVAITARDDLVEDLTTERGFRVQLEQDVEELLERGLVAEINEREEAFEIRCKTEQEETARVVAVHARMEEEYSLALKSSEQERARLEAVIASLEKKLQAERHTESVRAKEQEERATMGSEEIRSLRAGLLSRKKLRGNGRRQQQALAGRAADISKGQAGSKGNSLWLGAAQERLNAQKHTPRSGAAIRYPSRKTDQRNERACPRQPSSYVHKNDEKYALVDITGSSAAVGAPIVGKTHPSLARRGIGGGGGGDGGTPSVGYGGSGRGNGSVGHAVHASAVENVELFLGDFVPKVRAQPLAVAALLSAAAASEEKVGGGGQHGDGGGGACMKKTSKWAAIGRAGKMSARATAVCAEEATKAAEAEALHRLRSLINSTARALSASWFSLLTTVAATVAASRGPTHGGHGGDGSGSHGAAEEPGNSNDIDTAGEGQKSVDVNATVPAIVVRRLFQICGILKSNGGGPTLAHADMELKKNAVGKGKRSVGHREFFKIIVALSHSRFAGESKDEALEKLSRMLHQAQPDSAGTFPHARIQQGQGSDGGSAHRVEPLTAKPTPASARNSTSVHANATPVSSQGGAGQEDGLAGAEQVLERERRTLEAIFLHYSADGLVQSAALASFCKDFELTPGVVSREDAHRIYVQLAYPNETLLTPKLLAARERPQGRHGPGRGAGRDEQGGKREGGAAEGGFGLGVTQWIAWLGLAAVGCTWFDKQRGLYNTPEKKILGLLQWMEGSIGKKRINSKRGATIIPAFNLFPLRATCR